MYTCIVRILFLLLQPFTQKLHQIVQQTAQFVSQHGQQMEIIIKTKQTFNAHFSFLHYMDRLFPYYKHLLKVIASGEYVPVEEKGMENGGGNSAGMIKDSESKEDEGEDEEEEEDEGDELHPLLRGSVGSSSSGGVTIYLYHWSWLAGDVAEERMWVSLLHLFLYTALTVMYLLLDTLSHSLGEWNPCNQVYNYCSKKFAQILNTV